MNKRKKIDRAVLEIAVIGMAGRFPDAKNIAEFWNNLKNGKESITFFSDEDLENMGVDPSTIKDPNYVKAGGVVQDVEYFDASFFSYIPPEAEIMDPQMRFFHECTWQALEDAGYDPGSYEGLIGLYAGATPNLQWEGLSLLSGRIGQLGNFASMSLMNKEYLTTKISYKLNLRGPSSFVHTACSTSLAAIHWACRAILNGECHMAVAGAVKIIDFPPSGYLYEKDMILAPDGHCRAFDAKAKGTIPGSGIGIVVLKRLKNALKDRDNIYAVIKGTAINNDGNRKVGYTAPSVEGQAEVIRTAMAMARVDAESIGYIEAHGTGTPLGDQVEIEALKLAFNTNKKKFCSIGSVKTNIGHLDVAAGAAGFIKAVLALKHRLIPPSLHFETLNPTIDYENSPFYVVDRPTQWKNNGYPLRAGVSSFGIGGTNAHVVLEEWSDDPSPNARRTAHDATREHQLILLSAKTPSALHRITQNLVNHLKHNLSILSNPGNPINPGQNPGVNLADMAYTLQVGRQGFQHRRVTVCSDVGDVIDALSNEDSGKARTAFSKEGQRSPIFMFAGLGSQYVNMGAGLYRHEPVFRREMDRCFDILKSLMSYDLKDILYPGDSVNKESTSVSSVSSVAKNKNQPAANHLQPDINYIEIAQLAVFVLEYSLAKLIMNYGIKPHAMIGYSLGEYTAACLSGVFSLEDALKLMVARGRLVAKIPPGTMLSAPLPAKELKPFLNEEIAIAIDNGPSCILAGPDQHLDALQDKLKEKRYLCMRLPNSHAIHSRMLESILKEFEELLRTVTFNKPQIPYVSNVTGQWVTMVDAADPVYWCKHLTQTVRFADGIELIKKEPHPIFIEIGPGRDLSTLLVRHKENDPGQQTINLIRPAQQDVPDNYYLLSKIGQLWLYGVTIDWNEFHTGEERRRIPLPTYPFDRHRFWFEGNPFKTVTQMFTGQPLSQGKLNINFVNSLAEETSAPTLGKRSELSSPYVPAATETEKILVNLWEEFFGIKPLGINDDFFELGGDSLNAINIISAIRRELEVDVPLPDFFKRETIKKLSEFIDNATKTGFSAAITAAETKDCYALSSTQKRLYFLQQMDTGSISYNETQILELEGTLDREKVGEAFRKIIERHEILRTSVEMTGEEPIQRIHPAREIEFTIEYFHPEAPEKAGEIIQGFVKPFDLSRAPLLRTALVRISEDLHVLVIDIHHSVTDGWSNTVLALEFIRFYNQEDPLPPLKLQYKDYSEWQQSRQVKDALKQQEEYWLKEFADEIPVLTLSTDYQRPAFQSYEGGEVEFELGKEETTALNRMARSSRSTLFITLLAIYNVLLSKLSNLEDIVVGTPVAGRRHTDLEQIIGMFVNTLPLRNNPSGEKTFSHFIEEVKEQTLNAFENQEYPFEDLVEILPVERDISRNPLFDTMFMLQNITNTGELETMPDSEMAKIQIRPYAYEHKASKFDLTLNAFEKDEKLYFSFEYCTQLFREETIIRFIDYFKKIISQVIRAPGAKLSGIEIIPEQEKARILNEFNDTETDYPKDKTIRQLFEEQVERSPDHMAVIGRWSLRNEEAQITYGELNEKAGQLAQVLLGKGAGPDTIIGIMMERSLEMIIGIMGILKAGGAYLPLDPIFPLERINYILKDSDTGILLSSTAGEPASSAALEIIELDDIFEENSPTHLTQPTAPLTHSPAQLGYAIYTSGSTGKPKGVMVQHRALINFIKGITDIIPFVARDIILSLTTISFDIFGLETLLPLTKGSKVIVGDGEEQLNPEATAQTLSNKNVTILQVTPSRLTMLAAHETSAPCLKKLEYLLVGGEAFPEQLLEKTRELGVNKIFNMYGPTETTIWSAVKDVSPGEDLNIGKPIANTGIYILGEGRALQPVGIAGELCIAGDGLARGYLNRPELTAEKFDHDLWDYQDYPQSPIYLTGDLARWLPDGNLEYLGRLDCQIKLRGFRIELSEIEIALTRYETVKEAVVILYNEDSNPHLVAYVTLALPIAPLAEQKFNEVEGILRSWLKARLPDYMVPPFFVQLDEFPLTPNGKVDRKALPAPQLKAGASHISPSDPVEIQLAQLWSEVLGIKQDIISIDSNFFGLGGQSLKAITMMTNIEKEFDTKIELTWIFKHPTIREIASLIKTIRMASVSASEIETGEEKVRIKL